MKKFFAIILCVVVISVVLSGCGEAFTEVSREPINTKYTEAYDGVETEYKYKYNVLVGDWQLVPVIKTVRHTAKWSIQYRITYADGHQNTEWRDCTEEEYNRTKDKLMTDGKGADNGGGNT